MPQPDSFERSFEQLKSLLKEIEPSLLVREDEPDSYYLTAPPSDKAKRELFFGAVRRKKTYVSYHLMPIYMYPELLDRVSPELRTRMQGKSCFNFKSVHPYQLDELARLTHDCLARLQAEGLA